MESNNYNYEIKTENKIETKNEKDDSFLNKLKLFIIKNKIELGLLFVIIFTIFLSNDLKNNYLCSDPKNKIQIKNKSKSGGATVPIKSVPLTQRTTTTTTMGMSGYGQPGYGQPQSQSQMGYQIKSQLTSIGFMKLGSTIMNSSILSKIFCYIGSFIKTIFAMGSIVLAVMLIPGVPVFGFMLLLFVILRDKMANIKAL
jgi:hypothetical protein